MSVYVAATIYAWLGHILGIFLTPVGVRISERILPCAVFFLSAIIHFLVVDPFYTLLLLIFLLAVLGPRNPALRVICFLATVAAIPHTIVGPLSLPGNILIYNLTAHNVAALVLLLPLFFRASQQNAKAAPFSVIDFCLLFFVAVVAINVGLHNNVTTGLRSAIENALVILLPYAAMRYAIRDVEDLQVVVRGFVSVSLILACIALVASFKQWDFYRLLDPPTVFGIPDDRSGFIRIQVTANTHSLGFHLAAAVIMLQAIRCLPKMRLAQHLLARRFVVRTIYFESKSSVKEEDKSVRITWARLMLIRAALLGGIFFTDSRASLIALFVSLIMYWAFVRRRLRWLIISAGLVGGLVGIELAGSIDPTQFDPHGTFQYRIDLLTAGYEHILLHPLFGDHDFYSAPIFEALRQGQGIIDITNLYVLYALHYGLVGATLFFAAFFVPLLTYIFSNKAEEKACPDAPALNRIRGGAAAVVCGWLLLVVTTSDVALTNHVGLMFAAILASANHLVFQRESSKE